MFNGVLLVAIIATWILKVTSLPKLYHEDMLLCESISRSTSEEILNTVDNYIRTKGLDWHKCIGICTKGARAMCGRNRSAVTRILERNHKASWTHKNLHRAALVSKCISDDFKNVLKTSVKIVNFIKSTFLQLRLFEKLCKEMRSNHKSLLLHTEIRWLSRGKVLKKTCKTSSGNCYVCGR